MFKLFKTAAAKEKYAKKEKQVSQFIPYKAHWDKNTILTKSKGLLQVIKVGGFSFETADDDDLDIRKNVRNSLLKNMSSGNVTLYFHTIRRRRSVLEKNDSYGTGSIVSTSKDFISYLESEWDAKNSNTNSYFNELYISILYEQDKEGAAIVEYFLTKIKEKSSKDARESGLREMHESLEEMSTRVLNTLRDYDTRLLGVRKTNDGIFCEISEFLATIVNCGDSAPMMVPRSSLDE